MNTAITTTTPTDVTWRVAEQEQAIGQLANQYASTATFSDFNDLKSDRTLATYRQNLDSFCEYLGLGGLYRTADDLQHNAESWSFCTHGLVVGYRKWLLREGYAIATVNLRLATVRKYARLAAESETLSEREAGLIRLVGGYSTKEGKRIDGRREIARKPRKTGKSQKRHSTEIAVDHAAMLKSQPNTPQGRRDAVMMCIALDHGLRAGELSILRVSDFDLSDGTMRFYRPKVDKVQTHRLTANALAAVRAYIESGDAPGADDYLLRGSRKGGKLSAPGMTSVNISKRVKALGERVGIDRLSAHDCRHYWATQASRNGTDLASLMQAGGWSSPAMPMRYIEDMAIANEGVRVAE